LKSPVRETEIGGEFASTPAFDPQATKSKKTCQDPLPGQKSQRWKVCPNKKPNQPISEAKPWEFGFGNPASATRRSHRSGTLGFPSSDYSEFGFIGVLFFFPTSRTNFMQAKNFGLSFPKRNQGFSFSFKEAGTRTILPCRSTKAWSVVPVTNSTSSSFRQRR